MKDSKKRRVETLDDFLLLIIHYIWKDFMLLIALKVKMSEASQETLHTQRGVFMEDIEDLEYELTKLLKWSTVGAVKLIQQVTLGGGLFVMCVKRRSIDDVTEPHCLKDVLIQHEQSCEVNVKTEANERSLIFLAIILTYLQYISSNLNYQLYGLTTTTHIEIDAVDSLFPREIEISVIDMCGLHFLHIPELDYMYTGKDHLLQPATDTDSEAVDHTTVLVAAHSVSLSNSTSIDSGLQFSTQAYSFFHNLISFLLMLFPVLLETAPTETTMAEDKGKQNRPNRGAQKSFLVELKGSPNTGYCADMEFGDLAPQEFCMLVDTGSSNLAVAAKPLPGVSGHFNLDGSDTNFVDTTIPVSVTYSGGQWSGTLARDLVSIGGSLPVEVEFALINSASNFFISGAPWSGILGLAYDTLAKPDSSVKTFWQVLQGASGLRDRFALSICPHINFVNQGGLMAFGYISDTLYRGSVLYTSITKELYYNVIVTNLTVGDQQIELHCTEFNNDKAIIDSGTTDIYVPSKAFTAIVQVLKKHFKENVPLDVPESFWNGASKLAWPTDSKQILFEAFPPLYIGFAVDQDPSMEFALSVPAQIYLRQVSGSQEEKNKTDCLPECDFFVFGVKQRSKGMVIGGNAMLGFTTIFDREQRRVGFANSICNYADSTSEHLPSITGPYPREPVDCECHGCSLHLAYWEWIVYTCGAIVSVISILTVGYTIAKNLYKCYQKRCCCPSKLHCTVVCCNSNCCNRAPYSSVSGDELPGYSEELPIEETRPESEASEEGTSDNKPRPPLEKQDSGCYSAESSIQSTQLLQIESEPGDLEENMTLSHEKGTASTSGSYVPSLGSLPREDMGPLNTTRQMGCTYVHTVPKASTPRTVMPIILILHFT